jgi:hypothetical protein
MIESGFFCLITLAIWAIGLKAVLILSLISGWNFLIYETNAGQHELVKIAFLTKS